METCTSYMYTTLKEKWSHFDLESLVTGRTKIRPGIPINLRIFGVKMTRY